MYIYLGVISSWTCELVKIGDNGLTSSMYLFFKVPSITKKLNKLQLYFDVFLGAIYPKIPFLLLFAFHKQKTKMARIKN